MFNITAASVTSFHSSDADDVDDSGEDGVSVAVLAVAIVVPAVVAIIAITIAVVLYTKLRKLQNGEFDDCKRVSILLRVLLLHRNDNDQSVIFCNSSQAAAIHVIARHGTTCAQPPDV